jgi:hypothetical protein
LTIPKPLSTKSDNGSIYSRAEVFWICHRPRTFFLSRSAKYHDSQLLHRSRVVAGCAAPVILTRHAAMRGTAQASVTQRVQPGSLSSPPRFPRLTSCWLLAVSVERKVVITSSRRRCFSSSGTSSCSLRAAAVLPRSLYANRYAVSYPTCGGGSVRTGK